MRIVFLSNSRSGRGVSRRIAEHFPRVLRAAGHEVTTAAAGDAQGAFEAALVDAEVLVIAGGDGTVHRAAEEAIRARVPIYHVPCGNENLFAREFGMNRDPGRLLSALESRVLRTVDAAAVADPGAGAAVSGARSATMLLMCSVGPDAGVIRRLTALRTRAIGHLAYVEPVIRECLAPSVPPLTVGIDGAPFIDDRTGVLVIANSRQYALRIDPARDADMSDGLLDVVFLPGASPWTLALWGARCRLRLDLPRRGAVVARGREIRISSRSCAPYQIDGDSPGWLGAGVNGDALPDAASLDLRITVIPGALRVLVPQQP